MELYFEIVLLFVFAILLVLKLNEDNERKLWKNSEKNTKSETLKVFNGPVSLPLIGSAIQFFLIGITRNLYDTMEEFAKRYGPVSGFWVGPHYFVFVQDPVVGREILNQESLMRKFPATSITNELYGPLNLGISQAHGAVVKEMRRFSSRGLKRFGFGKFASMDDIVHFEISKFLNDFEISREKNQESVVFMNEAFYIPTLNVLWRLMTGDVFTQNDDRLITIIRHARDILKKDPIGGALPFAMTFLARIPGLTPFQEAKTFWTEIRSLLGEILEKRRLDGNFHEEPDCLMDLFLQEIEPGENPMYNDAQCIQTCMDLFLAGLDSTANTLDWMVMYLVSHPTVYERVMQEIKDTIGFEQRPTVHHKTLMPYTESVMLEVLRIANVITYTMRAPEQETMFQGYRVPDNSHIVIKLDSFHKSKEIWSDPEIFRPERFLDENSKIVNTEKIYTFGFGKRACIGELSSKLSLFLFLTTFLQKYSLSVSQFNPPPCLVPQHGVLITHPLPYHIKATPNPKINSFSLSRLRSRVGSSHKN